MIINMNGAKAPETPSPVLQEKTVTPETLPTVIGADEGYDGLSQVTVNPDAQLKAENIRSGKTVFGVTGAFTGETIYSDDLDLSKLKAPFNNATPNITQAISANLTNITYETVPRLTPAYAYRGSAPAVISYGEKKFWVAPEIDVYTSKVDSAKGGYLVRGTIPTLTYSCKSSNSISGDGILRLVFYNANYNGYGGQARFTTSELLTWEFNVHISGSGESEYETVTIPETSIEFIWNATSEGEPVTVTAFIYAYFTGVIS